MIQKTLNAIGVTYSHMNDDILVPSKIEAERTKQTLIVRGVLSLLYRWKLIFFVKKTRKKAKEKEGNEAPTVQWPPKRQHHKPAPRPTDQLRLSTLKNGCELTDLTFSGLLLVIKRWYNLG
jgi:DNA excision repair protein ERCC-6-like 2